MHTIHLPYGKETILANIPENRLRAVLESRLHTLTPSRDQGALVQEALDSPTGAGRLKDLAKGRKKVVLIASDHTRPVPSRIIIPAMLKDIREGSPEADITILIATGCHRGSTRSELVNKFGEEIVSHEKIVIHNCDDSDNMVSMGTLPSGGELVLNRLASEADLLCAEGFIEPHFFAGYSGGRKSVLPGVAARKTVLFNHCSSFIDNPFSRTGILDNNLIHQDMVYAAHKARLAFIVNVVLNQNKEIVCAVAGDCDSAHRKGTDFLNDWCRVKAVPSDIVISTNGGYPLDQNIYQAVKGMTAAEATVNPGGVIIMLAKSQDGHGGETFYETFCKETDPEQILERFLATPANQTIPDQWQSQIFARVLKRARIIYLSDAPDEVCRRLHMTPAHSMEEALDLADRILGVKDAGIAVIPDGVSVIVTP